MIIVILIAGCDQVTSYEQDKLITEKDGVKLYAHQSCWKDRNGAGRCNDEVYFTTPCGDVSYEQRVGKTIGKHQVNGNGCK